MRGAVVACGVCAALATGLPAQEVIWYRDAEIIYEEFGSSLATIPDRDADGCEELFVGAYGSDCNGRAYGSARMLRTQDGSETLRICGMGTNFLFGACVRGVGDLNGDGTRDLLVSARDYDDIDKGVGVGAVVLYSGIGGEQLDLLIGESRSVSFGASCASIADVDGDGVDDLLVGEPGFDELNLHGAALVYSGRTRALLRRYEGSVYEMTLGTAVARLGDVDADGTDDYSLFADLPYSQKMRGAVYVYSGATGAQLYAWQGTRDFGAFGASMTDAGDLDRDGHADLWIGELGGTGKGFVYAYSGKTGAVLYKLRSDYAQSLFGLAVAIAGDMNGDGEREILVGSPGDRHDGYYAGAALLFSGKTQRVLYHFYPGYEAAGLGNRVTAGFDANGDGIPDLAVAAQSAPPDETGYRLGGRVTVYAGNDLFLQSDVTDTQPGDVVHLDTRGGPEGSLALLAIVDVSGTPLFAPLALATLDAFGEATYTAEVPPEASGFTYTLQAWCQPPGSHALRDSGREVVTVQ